VRSGRRRAQWICRFRPNGAPAAFIQKFDDGRHVVVALSTIAVTDTRQAAMAVVDGLDGDHQNKK
jgi:hypothetical protein